MTNPRLEALYSAYRNQLNNYGTNVNYVPQWNPNVAPTPNNIPSGGEGVSAMGYRSLNPDGTYWDRYAQSIPDMQERVNATVNDAAVAQLADQITAGLLRAKYR